MGVDHKRRAEQAWSILVKRARSERSIDDMALTYGELCAKIGCHYRPAKYFLEIIQAYCHDNQLPPLPALVVTAKKGLPGKGYPGPGKKRRQHAQILKQIKEYKWESSVRF